MKNNKLNFLLLFFSMIIFFSCKKEAKILPQEQSPIFYLRGNLDGESVYFTVGADDYTSHFLKESTGDTLWGYTSIISSFNEKNSFQIRVQSVNSGNSSFFNNLQDIDYTLNSGVYTYDTNGGLRDPKEIAITLILNDYSYNTVGSQTGNNFEITSTEDYYEWFDYEKKNRLLKVTIQFSCNLYKDGQQFRFTNGEAVLVFGYDNVFP